MLPRPITHIENHDVPKQALRMRRHFMAVGASLLAIGLMFACYLQGFLPRAAFFESAALVLLADIVFFTAFLSGLNLRCRDPSLTVAQMLSATLVTLYAMYAADGGRAVFLVLLMMIFLFGVLLLTIRTLLVYAAGILAAYGTVIALLWHFKPQSLDLGLELLQWLVLAFTLPWFAVMGGFITGLRNKLHKRNEELQRMFHKVQASEASLALAQRIAGLGGWTYDPLRRSATWSAQTYRLFGIDPTQPAPVGAQFLQLVHPADRWHYAQFVQPALRESRAFDVQFRIVLPDGEIRCMHALGEPVLDANGHMTFLRGTFMDISAQKQFEQRQAMAYTVTLLLAESDTLADAAPKIIQSICETVGWDCGACWYWDQQDQLLRCSEWWSIASTEVNDFMAFSSQQQLTPESKGLIRRVWTNGEPIWIADVAREPGFLNAGSAAKAGLRGAFAFPIRMGAELHGVMEFYLRDVRQPDPALIAVARSIGCQIGQFIARKTAQDEIRQLAFYDPLTHLPNRRLLIDRLNHAMTASIRSKLHGALLFIDLDNFKNINDTLGHDQGDLLLQQVAERLSSCVRVGDTVARQGGDEFVIMLLNLSEAAQEAAIQTEAIGEKIREILDRPFHFAGHIHHNTASIGATLFDGDIESTDEHLKRADLAMYQAKAAGRNTLRFFESDMQATVTLRAALETDLRQGLQDQQFLLYYQAQIDDVGRVTGAEALVRWQHPIRGFTSPAEFIPFAEETGLILPLGRWVLETACWQLAAWSQETATVHLTMAVNVSARQFRQANFVEQVVELLDRTGANPQKLKLELTESMLLDNLEQIITKMNALKVLGVGFSLDDFGTGYSSLSYLKRLPLDQVKIDKSFVRDVFTDPHDAAIIRTIVALAQSLDLSVIAEGVETEPQRDFLANNGCHAYQGYLYSRPLPLHQFESLNLAHRKEMNGPNIHFMPANS